METGDIGEDRCVWVKRMGSPRRRNIGWSTLPVELLEVEGLTR